MYLPTHCAGYVANFQVDLRNGTSIATMMKDILMEFNVKGIDVYADNLFVSVDQLRWCAEHDINLAGTTRRTYGFPADVSCDEMEVIVDLNPNPKPCNLTLMLCFVCIVL